MVFLDPHKYQSSFAPGGYLVLVSLDMLISFLGEAYWVKSGVRKGKVGFTNEKVF
jgi:hypothetical protein